MRDRLRTYLENNVGVRLLRRIVDSELYPALIALLVFMAYCSRHEILFATLLVGFAAVTLILFPDLTPLLPPLFMFIFAVTLVHAPKLPTFSDYYFTTPLLISLGILIAVLVIALILHYWIWGGFARMFRTKTRLSFLILPLAVALLCNGLFAESYAPINFYYGLTTVLVWFFLYLVLFFGLPEGKDTIRYFCTTCQWTAILLIMELVYIFITRNVFVGGIIIEDRIYFGWGINNNYGAAVAILLPPLFYLASTRKNGWIQFLIAIAAYGAMILSLCRAAMLVGTVVFLACLVAVCLYGSNRGLFRLFLAISLLCGGTIAIVLREQLGETLSLILKAGVSDSGRFDLWRGGVDIFLRYPIFGGGFNAVSYYGLFHSWAGSSMPGMLHNTVIELFAAAGAFGGVAYLAYRARTVQLVLHRMTLERFFLGMMIAAIVGVGLLDNPMFNVYPTFFTTVALALIEKDYNDTVALPPVVGRPLQY